VTEPTITLHLRISVDQEPIEGVLCDEHGHEEPFTGWLGLMERLEALRAAEVATQ
jgi:hypothetical protein